MNENEVPTEVSLVKFLELIRDEAENAFDGKTETDDSLLAIMFWAKDALESARKLHD